MAESVVLHFRGVTWSVIRRSAEALGPSGVGESWVRFKGSAGGRVTLTPYGDLHLEYEAGEIEDLARILGGNPGLSVVLDLGRANQDDSVGLASRVVVLLLQKFGGVADDTFQEGIESYWLLREIEAGVIRSHGAFLDCYRPQPESSCRPDD